MTIEIKNGDSPIKQQEDIDVTQLKEESQEELWKEVSNEINDEGLWLYDDWDGFKITR